MSIAPVQGFPTLSSDQPEPTSVRAGYTQTKATTNPAEEPTQPVSGISQKEKSPAAKIVPVTYELPPDVVEVHQDPQLKSQVIVEYLDRSKNVVLQIPSTQELDVERGIAQEVQAAAKLRAKAQAAATGAPRPAAGSEGEKTHGD